MGKQGLEMDRKRERHDRSAGRERERRLDLNVPQVAGSALAAIAAAVLASRLGVYGTVIGAGVVSVVATCGGSVFQHLFRRTGEQLRDAAKAPRQMPVPDGEFGAATTYGTRVRGWKRSVLAAVVVFGVAMTGITTYEIASGKDLHGGTGTTVGSVARGGGGQSPASGTPDRTPHQNRNQDPDRSGNQQQTPDQGQDRDQSRDQSEGAPTPSPETGQEGGGEAVSPAPTPSSSTGADADAPESPKPPAPDADSRSRTPAADPAGP
ncbi:hypothetical protein [Streptomyces sp. NPDC000410]|uniref:hypothetical protein n=1 Tax=Streptomyces sp. NPDC000410 TaxID=3154254 RepID=UPI00331EDD14